MSGDLKESMPFKSKLELASALKSDASGLFNYLTGSFWLRGQIRNWLSELLVENCGDRSLSKFSWLPLMPWYLSVDFCDGPCNLSCRMCSGRASRPKKLVCISKRQMHKILRNVPTAEMVSLPSGTSDPLMNPDFVEVLAMLKERRLPCGLVTNGHLLKPESIAALAEYPYHVEFNVSIDSASPAKYKEIRGVELAPLLGKLESMMAMRRACPESGFTLNVMMVGMEDNIEELPQMIDLCAGLGVKSLKVQHCVGDGRPGDMMLNSKWREAVERGIEASAKLGVDLIVPLDSRPGSASSPAAPPLDGPAGEQASKRISMPQAAPERLTEILCSRFDNVQIRTNGHISPCCNLQEYPGGLNVFDGPLQANMKYLRYRLHFLQGGVLEECPPASNCYAMQRRRMDLAKGLVLPPLSFPQGF